MVIPAAVAGLSSLVAGGLSYLGGAQTNRMSRAFAREQMQWQEGMSNTAYQRAVADMQAAGLNPMLAYHQGGASSPSGSMPNLTNPLSGAVSSALDAQRMHAEVKNLQETNKNLQELNKEIRARARLNNASAKSVESTLPGKQLEADIDTRLGGVPSFALRFLQRLNPLSVFREMNSK